MRRTTIYLLLFLITFGIGSAVVFKFWKAEKIIESPKESQPETANVIVEPRTIPTPHKVFDQNGEEIFWQGESGGFNIRWTNKDIYVEKNNKTERLLSNYANFLFKKNLPALRNIENNCIYSVSGNIQSIAGSVLTLEIDEMTSCPPEAHPANEVYWIVFDLNNTSNINLLNGVSYSLKLKNFFSDKEILKAMLENEEIKSAMTEISPNYKSKTSIELARWFKRKDETWDYKKVSYGGDVANFGHKGQLNENSLAAFRFTGIEGNYVFVEIGLTAYRHLSSLKLKLKIPGKLREQIESANTRKEGFLEPLGKFTSKDFEVGTESVSK